MKDNLVMLLMKLFITLYPEVIHMKDKIVALCFHGFLTAS